MKNSTRRENCESRAWWISAQSIWNLIFKKFWFWMVGIQMPTVRILVFKWNFSKKNYSRRENCNRVWWILALKSECCNDSYSKHMIGQHSSHKIDVNSLDRFITNQINNYFHNDPAFRSLKMGWFEYQAEVQGLTTSVVRYSDPKWTFTMSSLSLIQFQNSLRLKLNQNRLLSATSLPRIDILEHYWSSW